MFVANKETVSVISTNSVRFWSWNSQVTGSALRERPYRAVVWSEAAHIWCHQGQQQQKNPNFLTKPQVLPLTARTKPDSTDCSSQIMVNKAYYEMPPHLHPISGLPVSHSTVSALI